METLRTAIEFVSNGTVSHGAAQTGDTFLFVSIITMLLCMVGLVFTLIQKQRIYSCNYVNYHSGQTRIINKGWSIATIIFIVLLTLSLISTIGVITANKAFADNSTNQKYTINVSDDSNTVYFVKSFEDPGLLVDEGSEVEFGVHDGMGYLYLTSPGSTDKQLIASAYPNRGYKFIEWEVNKHSKSNEPYIVKSDVTFNAITENVDPNKEGGTIQGRVLDELMGDPVSDVTVYFVPLHSKAQYEVLSDVNGFYRLSGIPLNTPGAVNFYKHDYVVDYTDTITLFQKDKEAFKDLGSISLSKGVVINIHSNIPEKSFHVWKYYIQNTVSPDPKQPPEPHLAEEFYANSFDDERLQIDALIRIMPDYECDQKGYKHNTLCYTYVSNSMGGKKYIGYAEPSDGEIVDYWQYSTNKLKNVAIPVTEKDEEAIKLAEEDSPYDIKLNYKFPDISPSADKDIDRSTRAAQTGDSVSTLIVLLFVVIGVSAGLVYASRRKSKL